MVARARSQRVPVDLSIHVGMPIDKAWGNHMALGVENFFGAGADFANRGNLPVDNTDIRAVARQAGTINDRTVFNDQIVVHAGSFGCVVVNVAYRGVEARAGIGTP